MHFMNCDNDFNVPYNRTYIKVKPFCESNNIHYKVYLHDREVQVQMFTDEKGIPHWHEFEKGETGLAKELGRLIEQQQKL